MLGTFQGPSEAMPTELDIAMGLGVTFYKGINLAVRIHIDAANGGSIMTKTLENALDLFEEMATTQNLWSSERSTSKKEA